MIQDLKNSAWAVGLWGALSVAFGILIVAWPEITLKAFLVVLAIYLLAAGAVTLVGSVADHAGHWIVGIIVGVLSILAGLYVFSNPEISALITLYLIAIWSIAVGALLIVAGFEDKKNGFWLILAGILGILYGIYIFANPGEGAISLIWLLSIYSVVTGVLLIIGAFKINSASNQLKASTAKK